MPWSTNRGKATNPKYRTKEHRAEVARLKAELERNGYAYCRQPACLMPSRLILPGMKWCAGHDDTGTSYIGHVHMRCNVVDGAKRGRARQHASRLRW